MTGLTAFWAVILNPAIITTGKRQLVFEPRWTALNYVAESLRARLTLAVGISFKLALIACRPWQFGTIPSKARFNCSFNLQNGSSP